MIFSYKWWDFCLSENENLLSIHFRSSKEIFTQVKMETCSRVHFCSRQKILAQAKIVLELDLFSSPSSLKREKFRSNKEILAQAKIFSLKLWKNLIFFVIIVWFFCNAFCGFKITDWFLRHNWYWTILKIMKVLRYLKLKLKSEWMYE